jgi:hypothetical protein
VGLGAGAGAGAGTGAGVACMWLGGGLGSRVWELGSRVRA